MPNKYIIDVCDQINKLGGWTEVTEPFKREYDSILNDPSQCLVPFSKKMIRELSENIGSSTNDPEGAVTKYLYLLFENLNKMIEQIEAIKEEKCGGYKEEEIYPEREYNAPAASFGATNRTFAIRNGKDRNGIKGHFVYFNPSYYHYEEVFKWKSNCLGEIGSLPPKETAETLMRLVELHEQNKIPKNYQDGAFQPLFDGDLNFTL